MGITRSFPVGHPFATLAPRGPCDHADHEQLARHEGGRGRSPVRAARAFALERRRSRAGRRRRPLRACRVRRAVHHGPRRAGRRDDYGLRPRAVPGRDPPAGGTCAAAVGLDRFVGLEDGLDAAVETARDHGAAIIAGHPHGARRDSIPGRTTQRWWHDPAVRSLAHRFELINRTQVFDWVAEAGLPAVASGDFHRSGHLATWKTVLPVEPDADTVVAYLRSQAPAMITRPAGLHALAQPAGVAA